MQVLLYFTRSKVIYFMAFFIAQRSVREATIRYGLGLGARIGIQ